MINLLPHREKKIVERVQVLRVVNVTLATAAFLIIAASLLLLPTLVTINSRYSLAESQMNTLEQEGITMSESDIAALESRAQQLSQKLAGKISSMPLMYIQVTQQALGQGIAVTGYGYSEGEVPKLSVSGVAPTRESLQNYIRNLESDTRVESVESPITNYVKSKNADFAITVTFKK